jgi:exosome complex exonuclease RRP6
LFQQGILACCNPVPPLVKQNLQTLHMIIFNARNKPLESLPVSSLSLTASSSSSALDSQLSNDTDYNENPLKCPLDLGPLADGAAGITTLIDRSVDRIVRKFKPAAQPARPLVKAKADLAVFSGRSKTVKASSDGLKAGVQFVSPFRRYELLRPYLDSIEQQEQRTQLQQQQKQHLDTKPSDIDMRFVVLKPLQKFWRYV